jgi:hypothetical protein
MKFTFVIIPEEQLLIERIEGDVTLEDLFELTPKVWSEPQYQKELSAVIDIRLATLKISTSEMSRLTDFLISSGKSATGDLALVVKERMETAMSYMFEKQMMHKRNVAVVSTVEAAYRFLERPASLHELLEGPDAKTFLS